jgi:hypothetical protein
MPGQQGNGSDRSTKLEVIYFLKFPERNMDFLGGNSKMRYCGKDDGENGRLLRFRELRRGR